MLTPGVMGGFEDVRPRVKQMGVYPAEEDR